MKRKLPLAIGGVMRCCALTLDEADVEEKEGEVLPCKYCKSSLIVKDRVWIWNRPSEWENFGQDKP